MSKDKENPKTAAEEAAEWLANAGVHKNHGRPLGYEELKGHGFTVSLIEDDSDLQDAVLTVFHAVCLGFDQTSMVKVVENHNGAGMTTQVDHE